MAENLFSPSWYRVAALKPRLRSHARIHRHNYRGEAWYVLQDPSSGKFHRFRPAAYHLIGLMDGERSVDAIWELANRQLGDEAPTQDETIRFLGQLHAADVLRCDVPPDTQELFERQQKQQRMKLKQRLIHPLAVRIPLFDPEPILRRGLPLVRPLFGWLGFALWLGVVVLALVMTGVHWTDLTENVADRVLTPRNLLMLWLIYPVVKALHEFGHAFAAKVWGGEVHEMGIMLLVLMPIPYVEASSASAFPEKHKRMVVGAAGIMVELFLASLALFVWLNVESGSVSAIAFNVMLIGGVSTLFFNGNPLLRFDGYYVLADAVEIPNLATRSKNYLGYLAQRYLFGKEDAQSPVSAPGERAWMLFYGIASFLYRMFIMFFIILYIAGKFFIIGALLAIFAVFTQLLLPLLKNIAFVFGSPRLQRHRARAVITTLGGVALLLVLLFLAPAPSWTRAEGVVWLPQQSQVRAEGEGFVVRLLAPEESRVRRGDALIELEDALLAARVELHQARLRELEASFIEQQFANRTQAEIIRQKIDNESAALARAEEKVAAMVIRSPADGIFIVPKAVDLPGRFVRRGELVAYVVDHGDMTVRVVVGQDDIGLVHQRTRKVEAQLDAYGSRPVPAEILREVPAAGDRLPTAALAGSGGGLFATDPTDPEGLRTLKKVFQIDLALPRQEQLELIGGRVQVRFDHGAEPLAQQWYRSLRQLFMSHFGV
jgi:putative peptide zinc metalloprotease protein